MDLQLAEIIARDTREQAVQDARTDLHRLQQRAIEAGRDESRRLIKVSHIDSDTGQATYRPAGRLLRDWYLHCYTNNLRSRLGSPAVTIDAQQVEDTSKLLHRLTPNRSALAALRAVAVLRDLADADAAHATVSIADTLHATAARRAVAHVPDRRFDADPVRIHVTRHWYLHSYLDHVQTTTRGPRPFPGAAAVEQHVAFTLATRTIKPIGTDAATIPSTLGVNNVTLAGRQSEPTTKGNPRLPIMENSAEEAARLMFNHSTELHGPVRPGSEESCASGNMMSGISEPAADSLSNGRSVPPRIS